MFCRRCRVEHPSYYQKCPRCGSKLIKKSKPSHIIPHLLIILSFIAFAYVGAQENTTNISFAQISDNKATTPSYTKTELSNIEICKKIAIDYYNTHSYQDGGVYDCDNMAQDVWNMMTAAGITSKIVVGNTALSDETISNSNHAWILACIDDEEDTWIAVECTNGSLIFDNPQYYQYAKSFDDPKIYRDFYTARDNMYVSYNEYVTYLKHYNSLVEEFNSATPEQQSTLLGRVKEAYIVLQDKQITYENYKEKYESY